MKKLIPILLILLSSCSSRHKTVEKQTEIQQGEITTEASRTEETQTEASGTLDLSRFLDQYSLQIEGKTSDYKLQFGDLTFTGNADLKLEKKTEKTDIHEVWRIQYVKRIQEVYRIHNMYRIHNVYKNSEVQRSGITFGQMMWGIPLLLIMGGVLWEMIRLKIKSKLKI